LKPIEDLPETANINMTYTTGSSNIQLNQNDTFKTCIDQKAYGIGIVSQDPNLR
jgi:hypothetical protein